MNNLPSIVITGASGFIGGYLVDYLKDEYKIFAVARRSRKEANIPYHPNLHWMQWDISNKTSVSDAWKFINEQGGADFIMHLAAFYDYSYKDNPVYDSVNVNGTKNMLELAEQLHVRRFIFASSLAACKFPEKGEAVSEKTSADADYHYARSKKEGEILVKNFSQNFPCTVVRFAAVYSDWCEYAPLFKFLSGWLSKKIDSRIIAGKGESAVPYIHIREICQFIKIILERSDSLLNFDIYNASPSGSSSHKELFEIATHYFFGKSVKSISLPKLLAYPALSLKNLLYALKLVAEEPFERFWMINYIDKKLTIDSSFTQAALNWKPTPRYHITRRLLFLLEKMKAHPGEWHVRNEATLKKFASRTNLVIYDKMMEQKEVLLVKIYERLIDENPNGIFTQYKGMEKNNFQCYISNLYHLLMATIRSNDRSLLLQYIDQIAIRRFAEGYEPKILCETLQAFSDVIINHLVSYKAMNKIRQDIYDNIGLSLQIAQDGIEDLYDELVRKMPVEGISNLSQLPDCKELQKMIHQLSAIYQVAPDDFNLTNEFLQNNLR